MIKDKDSFQEGKHTTRSHVAARMIGFMVLGIVATFVVYATWYTYHRHVVINQIAKCNYETTHPAMSTFMQSPSGVLTSVMSVAACPLIAVPPSFEDLVRGRIVFGDTGPTTSVNPYSFLDMLLGRYTLGPNLHTCDQSATTTDCSTFASTSIVSVPEPVPSAGH